MNKRAVIQATYVHASVSPIGTLRVVLRDAKGRPIATASLSAEDQAKFVEDCRSIAAGEFKQ